MTDLVEAKLSHNQVYGLSASDCQDPVNLPVYSLHDESKQNRETNLASLVANCEHVDQIRLKDTFVDSNLLVAKVGQVSHFIQLLSLLSQVGRKRYLETKFEKIQIDGRVEAHISLQISSHFQNQQSEDGGENEQTKFMSVWIKMRSDRVNKYLVTIFIRTPAGRENYMKAVQIEVERVDCEAIGGIREFISLEELQSIVTNGSVLFGVKVDII